MKIDWWTLGFQTVNVLVLVWLLKRFFWRPIAAMIAERQAAAQKTLADAQAQETRAADALTEIAATRAGFASERDAILAAAHAEADQASAALLAQARAQADALQSAAKAAIDADARASDKAWAGRSSRLGIDIARRLAARLDGPAVHATFLDWLVAAIHALPGPARQAVAAQTIPLQAISATPLDASEQAHATELIGAAFGAHPLVTYSTDAGMVAGLELHAPHLLVSNSWRADLDKILADFDHAE